LIIGNIFIKNVRYAIPNIQTNEHHIRVY